MRAIRRSHKHFVRFLPEALETYNKSGQILISTQFNPALWSPELAQIVDSYDPFFQPGDIVLVMYDVFIRGKNPQLNKYEERRNIMDDETIYWTFENEVLGKVIAYGTPFECYVPKPKDYYKKKNGMSQLDRRQETVFAKALRKNKGEVKRIVDAPKMIADYATYLVSGEMGGLKNLEKEVNKILDEKKAREDNILESNFWVELQGMPEFAGDNKYALVSAAMFVPLTYKNLLLIETCDIWCLANDVSEFNISTTQHN